MNLSFYSKKIIQEIRKFVNYLLENFNIIEIFFWVGKQG